MRLFFFFFFFGFRCCCPACSNYTFYRPRPVPSLWKAVDADLFSNITYQIRTESARQLFSLNAVTGELAMLQTLDFENLAAMGMGTSYTFQVEAMDQGGVMPPGRATVTVRITVRPAAPRPSPR